MFAKYARIEFNDLPMNLLLIRLKEPNNEAHNKILKDALTLSLESQGLDGMFEFFSIAQEQKEGKKVSIF